MALGQEEIGRRIAEARDEAGLSQPELASRLGLAHPQSISNYERGITEVPVKRLRRIAEATGKPMSFFCQNGDATPEAEGDEGAASELRERLAALERDREETRAEQQRQSRILDELLRLAQDERASREAPTEGSSTDD